jgi:hypothetical protein
MNLILAIVLLSLAATPLAILLGWLDRRGSRQLGSLVNGRDSEGWWRATMPWPQGVQEEDELAWSFRGSQQPGDAPSTRWPGPDEPDEMWIRPIQIRGQVRRR